MVFTREQIEAGRAIGYGQGLYDALLKAPSFEDIYKSLVQYESGYVGGTSPTAIRTGVRATYTGEQLSQKVTSGELLLPTGRTLESLGYGDREVSYETAFGPGNENPYYAVYTPKGLQSAVTANPEGVYANIQQGVSPSLLAPANKAIASAIRSSVGKYSAPVEAPGAPSGPAGPGVSATVLTGTALTRRPTDVDYDEEERLLAARSVLGRVGFLG